MIHCIAESGKGVKACAGGSVYTLLSIVRFFFLFRIDRLSLLSLIALHFFFQKRTFPFFFFFFFFPCLEVEAHHATLSYDLRGNRGSNCVLNPYHLFVSLGQSRLYRNKSNRQ